MIEGIVFEDYPVVQEAVPLSDRLREPLNATPDSAWANLFRVFHPPPRPAGTLKPPPAETFWESWVTGPLSRAGSALGRFFTAPLRGLKTTAIWFGGGIVIVLVVAVVGLVVVLRIVNKVQEG